MGSESQGDRLSLYSRKAYDAEEEANVAVPTFGTESVFKRRLGLVLLMGSLGLLGACGADRMQDAVSNARREISFAREFDTLYPGAKGFFSYYTGEKGPTTWNSKVGLFGRYILTMQVRVTMDADRIHVISHQDPSFFLMEVSQINPLGEGRVAINYGDTVRFTKDKWAVLVEKKGDLSALEIEVLKDKPVAGFDEHWHEG
jgi:hypothetical protein